MQMAGSRSGPAQVGFQPSPPPPLALFHPPRYASLLLPRWRPPLPQVLYRAAKQRFDEEEDFKTRVGGWFVSFGGCWSLFVALSSVAALRRRTRVGRGIVGFGGCRCWRP